MRAGRYRQRGSAAGSDTQRSDGLDGEVTRGMARPEHLLVELADARLRDLVDEAPPLGQLPASDATAEERAERAGVDARALLQHDARERALTPLLVRHAHDARFDHVRVRHE